MVAKYYHDWVNEFKPREIKLGKGRKGKPHWRYFRALRCDIAWKRQWDKILKAYRDEFPSGNLFIDYHDYSGLPAWLTPQLVNARMVKDPQYQGCMAVDFEDEDARVLFYLQWS